MTLAGHSARQFGGRIYRKIPLLLAVEGAVKEKITAEYGRINGLYTVNEFADDDTEIPDPYGQPLAVYGECFEVLKKLVRKTAERLDSFAGEEAGEDIFYEGEE